MAWMVDNADEFFLSRDLYVDAVGGGGGTGRHTADEEEEEDAMDQR